MDNFRFDQITAKDAKARYINKSIQYLALKPELLKEVKTDKELIERVILFAKNLFEYDVDNNILA